MIEAEDDAQREAIIDIILNSDDIELVKGFLISHGSTFVVSGDVLQIYGMLVEILYDIRMEELKKAVKRMMEDDGEGRVRPSAEFAKLCGAKYRATFQ